MCAGGRRARAKLLAAGQTSQLLRRVAHIGVDSLQQIVQALDLVSLRGRRTTGKGIIHQRRVTSGDKLTSASSPSSRAYQYSLSDGQPKRGVSLRQLSSP